MKAIVTVSVLKTSIRLEPENDFEAAMAEQAKKVALQGKPWSLDVQQSADDKSLTLYSYIND